jgi:hypothetical protein
MPSSSHRDRSQTVPNREARQTRSRTHWATTPGPSPDHSATRPGKSVAGAHRLPRPAAARARSPAGLPNGRYLLGMRHAPAPLPPPTTATRGPRPAPRELDENPGPSTTPLSACATAQHIQLCRLQRTPPREVSRRMATTMRQPNSTRLVSRPEQSFAVIEQQLPPTAPLRVLHRRQGGTFVGAAALGRYGQSRRRRGQRHAAPFGQRQPSRARRRHTCAITKAGLATGFARDAQIATCEARGVGDSPVVVTVGPKHPLSVGGVYPSSAANR